MGGSHSGLRRHLSLIHIWWLPKSRKVYDLDENGERIRLPSGNWKSHKEDTVDSVSYTHLDVYKRQPLMELHLNDEMVALLKSGRINNRLLCEICLLYTSRCV